MRGCQSQEVGRGSRNFCTDCFNQNRQTSSHIPNLERLGSSLAHMMRLYGSSLLQAISRLMTSALRLKRLLHHSATSSLTLYQRSIGQSMSFLTQSIGSHIGSLYLLIWVAFLLQNHGEGSQTRLERYLVHNSRYTSCCLRQ